MGYVSVFTFINNTIMAYQFGKITWRGSYKGHSIEKAESSLQEVYIVDGDRKRAYWSMADARRAINGVELKYYPVDVRNWLD